MGSHWLSIRKLHRIWKANIYIASHDDGWDEFVNFFYMLDQMTDADDRILLFIVGHGGVNSNNEYALGDGTSVPDSTLYKLFRILDAALDFVWMLTCYSGNFSSEYLSYLDTATQGYIIWLHDNKLYFSSEKQAIQQFTNDINNAVEYYIENGSIISEMGCSLNLAKGIFSDISSIDGSWIQYDFVSTDKSDLITSIWPSFLGGSWGTVIGVIYLPNGFILPY